MGNWSDSNQSSRYRTCLPTFKGNMKPKSIAKQLKEMSAHWNKNWMIKTGKPKSEQVFDGYKREDRKGDK